MIISDVYVKSNEPAGAPFADSRTSLRTSAAVVARTLWLHPVGPVERKSLPAVVDIPVPVVLGCFQGSNQEDPYGVVLAGSGLAVAAVARCSAGAEFGCLLGLTWPDLQLYRLALGYVLHGSPLLRGGQCQ